MGSQVTDEASVLEKFDRLVEAGTVLYTPDLKTIRLTDGALQFEFLITSALKSKPLAVWGNAELDDEQPDDRQQPQPKTITTASGAALQLDADGRLPGGDISVAGFVIDLVNAGSHVLMFNKFCVYRPHLILLTADGHRRQFEALGAADLEAARGVLEGLNDGGEQDFLAIFNCGKDGGCSRLHKHMQIIPAPSAFALWPDDGVQEREVPYRYLIKRFEGGGMPAAKELAGEYKRMLVEATKAVPGREEVVEEDGDGRGIAVPHNVILSRRWMVVVPRRRVGFEKADANAAGMMGVVWASGEETYEAWKELGPKWVLVEVGVRK
ncbi:hypothetical protein CkaCkLH20_10355 [Colletotrichum karsti]|uniref:ATP adenylyltransferase n=1 Tax=Colletotrichum karsti TaxID=1095194 RepID=A0A9P6LG86_9PEZI|nr:uncharacterized protein CkaCkLH20_10355 [Colletotrichum karsti]KAF9872263.1 hypothetical protein CkaCkLH20_10355 [Colletotrichum karsti]